MIGVPHGYRVRETTEEVGKPALRTCFRSRAERERDRLNARRTLPSYRYEVVKVPRGLDGRRWVVQAFQNVLEPVDS